MHRLECREADIPSGNDLTKAALRRLQRGSPDRAIAGAQLFGLQRVEYAKRISGISANVQVRRIDVLDRVLGVHDKCVAVGDASPESECRARQ